MASNNRWKEALLCPETSVSVTSQSVRLRRRRSICRIQRQRVMCFDAMRRTWDCCSWTVDNSWWSYDGKATQNAEYAWNTKRCVCALYVYNFYLQPSLSNIKCGSCNYDWPATLPSPHSFRCSGRAYIYSRLPYIQSPMTNLRRSEKGKHPLILTRSVPEQDGKSHFVLGNRRGKNIFRWWGGSFSEVSTRLRYAKFVSPGSEICRSVAPNLRGERRATSVKTGKMCKAGQNYLDGLQMNILTWVRECAILVQGLQPSGWQAPSGGLWHREAATQHRAHHVRRPRWVRRRGKSWVEGAGTGCFNNM